MLTIFRHIKTHLLLYCGDVTLSGVTPDGVIFAEELYGDDDWLAQHKLTFNEGIITTIDEQYGKSANIKPMDLPPDLIKPSYRSCCDFLQFSGARLRGILSEERLDDVLHPLSIADKIELVEYMDWDIDPMQLMGIAESVVLSHARIPDEDAMIVCRRVRIAYRLTEPTRDYDYDSLDVYLLHDVYPDDDEIDLLDCLNDDDEVDLLRPMDCLFHDGYLYVADGGEDEDVSSIHIFAYHADDTD